MLGVAAGGEEPWPNSLFSVPKSFIYRRSISTPLHVRPVQWEGPVRAANWDLPQENGHPNKGP